jgi:hypothetical protein
MKPEGEYQSVSAGFSALFDRRAESQDCTANIENRQIWEDEDRPALGLLSSQLCNFSHVRGSLF